MIHFRSGFGTKRSFRKNFKLQIDTEKVAYQENLALEHIFCDHCSGKY